MTATHSQNSRPTILLTGFGPFPGVTENISAKLVRSIAERAREEFSFHEFRDVILPTEWSDAPKRVSDLIEKLQPVLALHFGVSKTARGFCIETQGANVCRLDLDSAGQRPPRPYLFDGGPPAYDATLPIDVIVQRLENLDLPVSISNDAGAYLCNAVLYHALRAAEHIRCRTGFIHIPTVLSGPPLTFDQAVSGGLETIRAVLEFDLAGHR